MKPSLGTAAILHALARGYRYGFDIMEQTGLTSGTIYPALDRLEEAGLAASEWEDAAIARAEGRPSRRYFEITEAGKARLAEALERYRCLAPVELDGRTVPAAAPRKRES
ncbi:MAG: PadR family transcriptional regulator [Acidobacteriota bacterium]